MNYFAGTPREKKPVERSSSRWEYNIEVKLKEMGCGLDLSGLENPLYSGFCDCGCEYAGFTKG
jgi:hypothetical protein